MEIINKVKENQKLFVCRRAKGKQLANHLKNLFSKKWIKKKTG